MIEMNLNLLKAKLPILKKFGGQKNIIMSVEGSTMRLAAMDTNNNAVVTTLDIGDGQEELNITFNGKQFINIIESLNDEDIQISTVPGVNNHVLLVTDSGKRELAYQVEQPFEMPIIEDAVVLYRGSSQPGEIIKAMMHVESHVANRATLSAWVAEDLVFTFNTSEVAVLTEPFENLRSEEDGEEPFVIPDFNKEFLWIFSELEGEYVIYRSAGRTWIATDDCLFMMINMVNNIGEAIATNVIERVNGFTTTDDITVDRKQFADALGRIKASREDMETDGVNLVILDDSMVAFWKDTSSRVVEYMDVTGAAELFIPICVPLLVLEKALKVYGSSEQAIIKIAATAIIVEVGNYKNVIATMNRVRVPEEIQEDVEEYEAPEGMELSFE